MDCNTALYVEDPLPQSNPKVIPYYSGSDAMYANGYTTFPALTTIFTLTWNSDCTVTGCQLMNHDCTTVPTANANFYISSGYPWRLSYKRNAADGWAA